MIKNNEPAKTTVVSLYGCPGAGKSILQSGLVYQMRLASIPTMPVLEADKYLALKNVPITVLEDFHLIGRQVEEASARWAARVCDVAWAVEARLRRPDRAGPCPCAALPVPARPA